MPYQLPPVDDDIYKYLLDRTEPFEDINSVLRRLLDMESDSPLPPSVRPVAPGAPSRSRTTSGTKKASARTRKQRPARTRAAKGSIVPESSYEVPILTAIAELGGRAPSREAIDRVGEILASEMSDADREPIASGDLRWRNRAQFVRLALIKSGDMKSDSPRGVWEITDKGRERVAQGAE